MSTADDSTTGDSRPKYTHGHEPATLAAHATRTAANSAAYLAPLLRPGMELLDVGCGPGTITLDLAQLIAPGRAVGIENTPAPIETARRNAADRGDASTRFEVADGAHLEYADDSFDVVHAHQVLQHVPDPVRVLREMGRVCRPDGWIAVRDADYAAMAWYPESPELDLWLDTYRRIARANHGQPDAGRRLRAWAHQAGLTDVRVTTSNWTYASPEAARWWGTSQAARVSGEMFTSQALAAGLVPADVARMADGWRTWAEHPDAWFVIVHGELLAHPAAADGDERASG